MIRIIDAIQNLNLLFNGSLVINSAGMAPYAVFDGASNYATNPSLEEFEATFGGFTVGAWVYTATASSHIAGVWNATTNNRVWQLYIGSLFKPGFAVSSDGVTPTVVTNAASITANTWTFILGRYYPGNSMSIWVNDVKTTNLVIPAGSLWPPAAGNGQLTVGIAGDGASIFNGRMSLLFFCNAVISDLYVSSLYTMGRTLFNV